MKKNLSVADMLFRSFTETYLQLDQLEHIQLTHFAIFQNQTLKPEHYLIKHEEVLPHEKHNSYPSLGDYGTDQIFIRIDANVTLSLSNLLTLFHSTPLNFFRQILKPP